MASKEKAEFVRSRFPDIHLINPFVDYKKVAQIKNSLVENNFYTEGTKHNCNDSAIINIILTAQGKKVSNRVRPRKQKCTIY